MITNFEHLTYDLTAEECKLVKILINGFRKKSKSNPIKGKEICDAINCQMERFGLSSKLTEVRLRKLVNFIRCQRILPLIGTSKGYFVSYDREEIEKEVKSLEERAAAILASAEGLRQMLNG